MAEAKPGCFKWHSHCWLCSDDGTCSRTQATTEEFNGDSNDCRTAYTGTNF